jgi:hypothetical protein
MGELNTDDSKKTLKREYARSQMSAIAEEQNEGLDLEKVNQYSEYLQEAANSSDILSKSLINNDEAA